MTKAVSQMTVPELQARARAIHLARPNASPAESAKLTQELNAIGVELAKLVRRTPIECISAAA